MSTKRILLVEDEENLLQTIRLNLELEGYQVVGVDDGKKALAEFKNARFDLILLDVMLPELNGFDVCERIRLENKSIPILFLTAKGSGEDRIKGLKLGADDYLTKPFNLEELLLRIQILLKRNTSLATELKSPDKISFGKNEINFSSYEIIGVEGEKLPVNKKELMLLRLLIEHKGEVVSREEILEKVWGYDVYPSTRTIDNYILAFRKYFEENPKQPKHFHSVRGVGYRFTE